jgi:hypothetical protein
MRPSTEIDELAGRLRQRRQAGPNGGPDGPRPASYVLFLGGGCSAAAGVPTTVQLARRALETFRLETAPAKLPDDELVQRFYKHLERMSPAQVARMLQSLFASVPIPPFYLDLARLIRRGWFPQILTTSYDNLLEKALDRVGVAASRLQIVSLGPQTPSLPSEEPEDALASIVKLHGDLAQSAVQLMPHDIARALSASRRFVSSELLGDLIVVGHTAGDDPVDQFFARSPQRELWWVSEQPQPDATLAAWASQVQVIGGELGRPERFFPQLALRLADAAASLADEAELESAGLELAAASPSEPQSPELAALRGEILSNQRALYHLDKEFPSSSRPPQVQVQIEFQKQQLSQLEDRLLSSSAQPRLFELLDQVRAAVGAAELGPKESQDARAFLDQHIEALRRELAKPTPNSLVVSGALGATLALADRLSTTNAEAIDRSTMSELASFAPSAAGKVVF